MILSNYTAYSVFSYLLTLNLGYHIRSLRVCILSCNLYWSSIPHCYQIKNFKYNVSNKYLTSVLSFYDNKITQICFQSFRATLLSLISGVLTLLSNSATFFALNVPKGTSSHGTLHYSSSPNSSS